MSGQAPSPQKTVFLDRDGVINRRLVGDYVSRWADFDILAGALPAIARLNQAGFRTVVVTNQRGLAIGRTQPEALAEIHRRLSEAAARAGARLTEFYVCPHDYDDGCLCRKPKPGLLDQANEAAPVDWARSFLIGDSDSDIRAGQARGVAAIKVAGPSLASPDHEAPDLAAAADIVLGRRPG